MTIGQAWPVLAGGALVGLIFFFLALRAGRRLRLLLDTPTSKARGVFIGQVELAGRAVAAAPLRTYLAGAEAVWYRYEISEEWERWETETYKDNQGRTQTRRVRRSGWTTVDAGGEEPAFFVEDETGAVRVWPEGATVEAPTVFAETAGRGSPLYYSKGPAGAVADSTGRRRFTEKAIGWRADVFVAGRARERADVVAPEIAADREADLFLISCRGEGRVVKGYRAQFWIFGVLVVLAAGATGVCATLPAGGEPDWPVGVLAAAGGALLLGGGWSWMAFNSLVHLRNRVAQARSLVEVQLKRRADLIPRLVDVVAGLRDHEQRVQTELAALRAQAMATAPWQPGPDVAGARKTFAAVAEQYPALRADEAFLRLQRELADTETRIALARDYYNGIATQANTRREIVPDRWLAGLAGLVAQPLFVAESFERAAVRIDLGGGPAPAAAADRA